MILLRSHLNWYGVNLSLFFSILNFRNAHLVSRLNWAIWNKGICCMQFIQHNMRYASTAIVAHSICVRRQLIRLHTVEEKTVSNRNYPLWICYEWIELSWFLFPFIVLPSQNGILQENRCYSFTNLTIILFQIEWYVSFQWLFFY